MKKERTWLRVRLILGAILGAVLAPVLVYFLWGSFLMPPNVRPVALPGTIFPVVFPEMAQQFGSIFTAIVVQSLLGAVLGYVIALATKPFADEGRELVSYSLFHYACTMAAAALLMGVCRWVTWAGVPLYLFLITILYALIWLGRWIGWYLEVVEIRTLLGLDPGPTPLKWRESLPYLFFALLTCCGLPLLLRALEVYLLGAGKYVTLSGLIYPCLILPVVSAASGLSLGKRQGVCPLYPAACFLFWLPLPHVIGGGTFAAQGLLAALPALAGNMVGWMYRRAVPKKR